MTAIEEIVAGYLEQAEGDALAALQALAADAAAVEAERNGYRSLVSSGLIRAKPQT